jgi:peptidoglycan/LPS O-acetylase OafA/YrhL
MTETKTRSDARIPELDGIRGIAIGMILFAHLTQVVTQPGSPLAYAFIPFRLAWTGVDLFFVLSGFLIGGILLDAKESSNYFRVFYTRRFFRIVPIYTVLLISAAICMRLSKAGYVGNYEELYVGKLPWVLFLLFLQNIGMSIRQVWGTYPLGVTWSLAVEEQFYLTLPLVIRLLNRRALLRFIFAVIVAVPLLRTWFYHHNHLNFFTWYTLMPCRADELLIGVLGAVAIREARWKAWLLANRKLFRSVAYVLLLGMGVLILRAPSYDSPLMISAGFTWMALFYLSCLLYGVLFPDSVLSHCLRWGWLRGLGIIAYGTYLFHMLFISLIYGRIPWIHSWHDMGLSLIVLVVTLVFCQTSWLYFEKPLVKIGHRLQYKFEASPKTASTTAPLRVSVP